MLIKNANIVTWSTPNSILENHSMLISGSKITKIGKFEDLKKNYPNEEVIDAKGQYIFPGNICAHTHFYGAFARGMAIPGNPAQNFPEILNKLWWPLDKALEQEDIYYSALVCLIDAIRHGTTSLFDHHASQRNVAGSLDQIERAVLESGVRADLCYEVSDREGEEIAKEGIDENVRFINNVLKNKNGLLNAHFGLHAGMTISQKTLNQCRNATPADVGFHIHVGEYTSDEYDSVDKYQMRIIDRLEKANILGDKTIVVHGVNLDALEMTLLSNTGTWVSHQPRSNMNNGVGLPAVEDMLRLGIKVCLGNDGFSNAMWEEWKAAYLSHKLIHRDPRRMGGEKIVQIAITNNGKLATEAFGTGTIGEIKENAQADLIFVEYYPYTELTASNLPWHMIFGFHEDVILSTMVAGKFLMKNRELLTLDEEAITHESRKRCKEVWNKYNQYV